MSSSARLQYNGVLTHESFNYSVFRGTCGALEMKRIRYALAIVLVTWPALLALAAAPGKPASIHGQGCLAAGVEAHCLVLRDLKSGRLFNLLFRGIQPAVGEGIEFDALPHQGPSTCMQGTALDVTGWVRKDTLKCKPGAAQKR
jgi:hypothetical protein